MKAGSKRRIGILLYYVLPLLCWIGLIHFSSSQSYEDQNVQPLFQGVNLDWVNQWFSWVSFQYGGTIVSLETRTPAAFVEFFLRKGAHVFVYAVLGVLVYRLAKQYLLSKFWAGSTAWLFVILYASIDEYRQFLHPYRTGLVEDVILDSIAGLLGILIFIGGARHSAGH